MTRTYRIRCYPTKSQIKKIEMSLNVCRFVWNRYLEHILKSIKSKKSYMDNEKFSKYFNETKKMDPSLKFVIKCPEKFIRGTIDNLYDAMKDYHNKITGFPKFKSKKRNPIRSLYLRNDPRSSGSNKGIRNYIRFMDDKHYMIIPNIGKIKVKYRKYDELKRPDTREVISGRLIKDGNKYYICLIYNKEPIDNISKYNINLGIDMGIENYVTLYYSNDTHYSHESILKDKRYIRIENKIKKLQEIISYKQEINYQILLKEYVNEHGKEPKEKYKNIMKGESFNTLNIKRLWDRIRKLFIKRTNIVRDYINKLVNDILVRTKPRYITIETLNIRDMLENDSSSTLHDHIAKSNWYRFFQCLKNKCEEYCIQLRKANRYFPSSKICSNCGKKNKNLTLNDRVFICKCGLNIDRDLNAAINLCKLTKYTIVV